MASHLTARDLACFHPDQILIDDTIQERLEQLGHAQRDIMQLPPHAQYGQLANERMAAFWHLDADLELLGRHSFPYFERNEENSMSITTDAIFHQIKRLDGYAMNNDSLAEERDAAGDTIAAQYLRGKAEAYRLAAFNLRQMIEEEKP